MAKSKDQDEENRELIKQILEGILSNDADLKSLGYEGINPQTLKEAKELLKKMNKT